MTSRYIFFNLSTGVPSYISFPTYENLYANKQTYGEDIAIKLPDADLTDSDIILQTYHWTGTEIGTHLPNVNPHYIWDYVTFSYIEPPGYIDIKKLEKTGEIDSIRSFKNLLPIMYQETLWDADQIAQNNIQGKLVEISSKQILNIVDANLFWKDTANVIHTWSTMDEYLLWLRGLAIAIAERTTNLYTIAWTKKAEVEALLTVTDVVTYDTNIGF